MLAHHLFSVSDPLLAVSSKKFEKGAHFAENAKIWKFSTYHNFKTTRALGFSLGL